METLRSLWRDEAGFTVSIELILIATITVIGLVTAMAASRDAVTAELSDVAGAIQDLNQSYVVFGVRGHTSSVSGSDYDDRRDYCDGAEDVLNNFDNCIVVLPAFLSPQEATSGGGQGYPTPINF